MPNILGPIRIANQAVVSGSSLTMVLAPDRKVATLDAIAASCGASGAIATGKASSARAISDVVADQDSDRD
jgi:hypothetical protein